MAFHRLTVPSYFGGLPGGYDYVNNAIVGTPALADSARADSGPNNGTYFVGTGENARGLIANRGLKALAQNCDLLDDYAHRDLAIPAVTADVTAGGTVTSIVLTGPIFIGMAGTPNTVAGIRRFVTLVDAEDNEIYNGTECQVTAISPDVPGAVWSAGNVTLTISPGIPISTVYRVYYSTRGNTASILDDALVGSRRQYNRYNGGANWADGTTNPATFVTAQLDKILTELAASTGANKLGYDGGAAWADGVTNPATTLGLQLDKILTDLSAVTGTAKIGGDAIAGTPYSTPAGTLRAQLVDVWADLNAENVALAAEVTRATTVEAPLVASYNELANFAALQALTGLADRTLRVVKYFGRYRFDLSSTATGITPFVIIPGDNIGRWVREGIASDGQLAGTHFRTATVSPPYTGYANPRWLVWNPVARIWIGGSSTNDTSYYSVDDGATWILRSTGMASARKTDGVGACDFTDGTTQFSEANSMGAGYEWSATTRAWTSINFNNSGLATATSFLYDPVNDYMIMLGIEGAVTKLSIQNRNGVHSYLQNNASVPSTNSLNTYVYTAGVNPITGRVVAMPSSPVAGVVRFMTSDDGGQNWTDRSGAVAYSASYPFRSAPVYDEMRKRWWMFESNISTFPTNATRIVYSDDDGLTWAILMTTTNMALYGPTLVGLTLVAANREGEPMYSVDGLSWFRCSGGQTTGSSGAVHCVNGRKGVPLIANNGNPCIVSATGLPGRNSEVVT